MSKDSKRHPVRNLIWGALALVGLAALVPRVAAARKDFQVKYGKKKG